MKNNNIYSIMAVLCVLLFSACTTYQVTTKSLLEQFASTQKDKKITITPPFYFPGTANGNSLKEVRCIDQNGNGHTIPVTNKTGIVITKKDNTTATYNFESLMVKDSTINSTQANNANSKPIKLDDISKMVVK